MSDAFCDAYGKDPVLATKTFEPSKIFATVPIRIICNAMMEAFLVGLDSGNFKTSERGNGADELTSSVGVAVEQFDLASNVFLEKNLDYMSAFLDELQNENSRLQHFQRQHVRTQNQINAYLHKVKDI